MQFNLRLKERKNVLNTALLLHYKMMPENWINMEIISTIYITLLNIMNSQISSLDQKHVMII